MASGDDGFGPKLPGYFDFTLVFEHSLFSLLPAVAFVLVAPCRIAQLWRRRECVGSRTLLFTKLSTASVLFALQTSIADGVLGVLESITILALSFFEHRRSPSQSLLLSIYLIIRAAEQPPLAGVLTAALLARLCLLVLEEMPKTLLAREKSQSRETRAGFISRSVFWWLNGFLSTGYTSVLDVNHMGPMAPKFDSQILLQKLEKVWDTDGKQGSNSLLKCTFLAYKGQFAAGVLPRLLYSGFTLSQPFLISSVVGYVSQGDHRNGTEGASLIGATILLYTGRAVSHAWYRHATYQLLTMYRGGLVALVFKRTLEIEASGIRDMAPVTLMSTDVESIAAGGAVLHDIWAALIELPLSLFLLYRQVGVPSLLILVPALVTTVCAAVIAPKLGPARVLWNTAIQQRVGDTSNMLSQIKGVKMMGLTDFFLARLQESRARELRLSVKFRWIQVYLHGLATASASTTPVIVILAAIFWTKADEGLSVAAAFTSLSIIAIASNPILILLVSMMQLFGIVGSFTRLQEFLLSEVRKDLRCLSDKSDKSCPPLSTHDQTIPLIHCSRGVEMASISAREPSETVVESKDATFSIGDKKGVLRGISLQIHRGTLTMVVGRVGCGKSSFLKAMVGELPIDSGSVDSGSQYAAYCDQTPWILNVTIEQNIVGQSQYDEKWFKTVVAACGLDEDFAALANGQQTLVGSGGVALSGGQKQRVSLARAVFSAKDFVVLDDVFSGLDTKTSKSVFNRLLSRDGLLRRNGQTVVMATNNVNFLTAADCITMMEDGCIVRNQVPYSAFGPSDWGVLEDETDSSVVFEDPVERVQFEKPLQRAELDIEKKTKQVEIELSRQTGDIDCYKIYLNALGISIVVITVILVCVSVGIEKMPQIWLRLWTERGTNTSKLRYMGGYVAFAILASFFQPVIIAYFLIVGVPRSANRLHTTLLTAVMRAPLHFFTSTDNGITLNRFSQDMSLIDQALPMAFVGTVILVVQAIADTAVIASGASYVGVIIPFGLVAVYMIQRYYLRTSRQIRFLDLELKSPLYTQFTETIAGLATIRAFGWARAIKAENYQRLNTSQKPYYMMFCIQRWLQVVLDLFSAGMALVLVIFAVILPSSTSGGAVGLALVNVISFNFTLSSVIMAWTQLETSLGAIARLKWFNKYTPNENKSEETEKPGVDWPSQGRIELENVVAAYSNDGEDILRGVTLMIEPGAKVGVCGRSGSGKSSLIAALSRLLELRSGTMRIDGIDLARLPRQLIRSRLSAFPQDAFRLPGTVRHSLDPEGKTQADEPLIQALTKAAMWPFLQSRGGLDAKHEDLNLSAGQLQLICMARISLRCGSSTGGGVVLLDEATSSVDTRTDDEVRLALGPDLDGKTVVEVAHRLEIVRHYDIIVVMAGGKVAEVGSPDELLATPGSEFQALWNSRRP
ncbi:ABC multidrug [Cordyceps militaris]|uniref:ABC multidrug n=1 Tax=Cordyceps militaris TaxID=73501 RepID=A0A2H4SMA3_CORMI|nr:ABC multidrug [Cordyceps militaris]